MNLSVFPSDTFFRNYRFIEISVIADIFLSCYRLSVIAIRLFVSDLSVIAIRFSVIVPTTDYYMHYYVFSVTTYIPECDNTALCVTGVSVYQCRETWGKHTNHKTIHMCRISGDTAFQRTQAVYWTKLYYIHLSVYTVYCIATVLLNYAISYKISLM